MKEPHIFDVIADLVSSHVADQMRLVDDRVIEAIARVYALHNEGMECPCDYCLAMRLAAELSLDEELASSALPPGDRI